jgi:cholesterol oxidase
MHLQALAEVDVIRARPEGGYEVDFLLRDAQQPAKTTRRTVVADRVIVAAGTVGTNAILLRSQARGTLPHLSPRLGFGFSTNGDGLHFLEPTRERVYLTRGPVTTSYAHFHSATSGDGADPARFHTVEDNGIPRVLTTLTGVGIPMLRSLTSGRGRHAKLFLLLALVRWFVWRFLPGLVVSLLRASGQRQALFRSEDEYTERMMCVATMGREGALGQFRLGDAAAGETELRVQRTDGKAFHEDPIYQEIQRTLDRLAPTLTTVKRRTFLNPFLKLGRGGLAAPLALSHPLGGCGMGHSAADGVVDEYGRVFDRTQTGERPFYAGLYVADASVIPTALGVNPSLTIAALALRSANQIIQELDRVPEGDA